MPYNETEYAIVVATALNYKGVNALRYIKDEFGIKTSLGTYKRYHARIDKTMPAELKNEADQKIQKHIQRLNLFRSWRIKLSKAMQDTEIKPEALSRMIIRAAELEKYIAQLESMSISYYEKNVKQVLVNN